MSGFLQGFNGDEMLLEMRDDQVVRAVVTKAIEIAMLGLPEQFNALCNTLATHDKFASLAERYELQCIWKHSGSHPPNLDRINGDTGLVMSDEDLKKKGLDVRKQFTHLPQWIDWDEPTCINHATIEKLEQIIESAGQHSAASTGYDAMKLSAAYAAIIAIAYDLDLVEIVNKYVPVALRRIHANQQARYLSLIPGVWKGFLLPGLLRQELEVSKESIESYSQYVNETADKRLRHGAFHPQAMYSGYSVAQLLDVIDRNTRSDDKYDDEDHNPDVSEGILQKDTILRTPATEAQITEAETRLGRQLPDDIKEFYKTTNGCGRVRLGTNYFLSRLPPLDELFLENDGYMDDYGFSMIPFLPFNVFDKIKWPNMADGGIAMYEHDGQGTQYVWIVSANDIKIAKERLHEAYKVVSDDERAIIDQNIRYWFGSREKFDNCQNHCYYEVHWGEAAQGIFPTFKMFLARVAADSEHYVERSPIAAPVP